MTVLGQLILPLPSVMVGMPYGLFEAAVATEPDEIARLTQDARHVLNFVEGLATSGRFLQERLIAEDPATLEEVAGIDPDDLLTLERQASADLSRMRGAAEKLQVQTNARAPQLVGPIAALIAVMDQTNVRYLETLRDVRWALSLARADSAPAEAGSLVRGSDDLRAWAEAINDRA